MTASNPIHNQCLFPPAPEPKGFHKYCRLFADWTKTGIVFLFWFVIGTGALTLAILCLVLFYFGFCIVFKAIGG